MSQSERNYDANLKPLAVGEVGVYTIATGTDALWNKSGSPDSVILDGETLRFKTDQEVRDENAPQLIEALYNLAMTCQCKNIDLNLDRVMAKADTIVACTAAIETDYPLCLANGDWLQGLWVEYYTRRTALIANEAYNESFEAYSVIPNDYLACNLEVNG